MQLIPSNDLVTLGAGRLEVVISPTVGGSIARFLFVVEDQRVPILRGCDGASSDVLAMGSFPLVPYVNRIRDGRFDFRGRQVEIAPNMRGDPSPLHGQGWLGPWQVTAASDRQATLVFEHQAGEWPWTYRAEQRFMLDEDGLTVELRCENLSADPMPCGLGQHPYFHCSPKTRLRTEVDHVWTIDEQVLPIEQVAATGDYDLADRLVCGLGLDHGFGGWGGAAHLSDPVWPFDLTMSSNDAEFFQLYSPAQGGIFVVEPVTHANAALNAAQEDWKELGLKVLEPGGAMSLTMRLDVTARL